MNKRISKIENDVQDRNSVAWKKLCDYVDKVVAENRDEFSPSEELGQELLYTLFNKIRAVVNKSTLK